MTATESVSRAADDDNQFVALFCVSPIQLTVSLARWTRTEVAQLDVDETRVCCDVRMSRFT